MKTKIANQTAIDALKAKGWTVLGACEVITWRPGWSCGVWESETIHRMQGVEIQSPPGMRRKDAKSMVYHTLNAAR